MYHSSSQLHFAPNLDTYKENSIHGKNFPVPPPDLIEGEEEYKIEKILCHHRTPTNHFFLIRWKGYSTEEDSWIPKQDLINAKSTLTDYKKLHPSLFSSSSHPFKN